MKKKMKTLIENREEALHEKKLGQFSEERIRLHIKRCGNEKKRTQVSRLKTGRPKGTLRPFGQPTKKAAGSKVKKGGKKPSTRTEKKKA